MDKPTKYCELTITLLNGQTLTGLLHVPVVTSSTIRPSDALQDKTDGFLLLSDATILENNAPRRANALMVAVQAISHIELPTAWASRLGQSAVVNTRPGFPLDPVSKSQKQSGTSKSAMGTK